MLEVPVEDVEDVDCAIDDREAMGHSRYLVSEGVERGKGKRVTVLGGGPAAQGCGESNIMALFGPCSKLREAPRKS